MTKLFVSGSKISGNGYILVPYHFAEDDTYSSNEMVSVSVFSVDGDVVRVEIPAIFGNDEDLLQKALGCYFNHMVVGGYRSIGELFVEGNAAIVFLKTIKYA